MHDALAYAQQIAVNNNNNNNNSSSSSASRRETSRRSICKTCLPEETFLSLRCC